MKAVYIEAHGGPEVLTYGERPDPEHGPNEVLVRVRASALNRLDLYTREGGRGLRREFPPPLILGGDCAGEVAAVGSGVSGLAEGDRVERNQTVALMESMKMELVITAPRAGMVRRVSVEPGQQVDRGMRLLELGPETDGG